VSDETIRMLCPNLTCRRVLAVPVSARGRTVRCRGCGTNLRIPDAAIANPAPAPAVEASAAQPQGRKKSA